MGFSAVKTIERAEVSIKKHFPWVTRCSLQGCDIDAINDVIRLLIKLEERYPQAARLIEVIEAIELPMKFTDGVPVAHQMACYDSEAKSLVLNLGFYSERSVIDEVMEEASHCHLVCYCYPRAIYPVAHAYAHILLQWIAISENDIAVRTYSGKPIDLMSHFMVRHPFDASVSETAEMSRDELFAETFAAYYGDGFIKHNVSRTIELVSEVTRQIELSGRAEPGCVTEIEADLTK